MQHRIPTAFRREQTSQRNAYSNSNLSTDAPIVSRAAARRFVPSVVTVILARVISWRKSSRKSCAIFSSYTDSSSQCNELVFAPSTWCCDKLSHPPRPVSDSIMYASQKSSCTFTFLGLAIRFRESYTIASRLTCKMCTWNIFEQARL